MSKITLADIAKLTNVSVSTVSRALHDNPQISAEVKKRIQAVANEHHYHIHLGARNLRLRRSNVIGLVLPIEADDFLTFANPFVLEFIGAIGVELRKNGLNLMLTHERVINQQLWDSGLVDGYIQLGHGVQPHKLKEGVADLPLVVWGAHLPNQPYCTVGVNNRCLARQAVEHLLKLGRKVIGIVVGNFGEQNTESYFRYCGYLDALKQANIPYDPRLVVFTDFDSRSGYEAAQHLLQQAPDVDAIFAANGDIVALATINAVLHSGRAVPYDVSVVGFDNIDLAVHFGIPLTTVSQELKPTGAQILVEALLKQLIGEKPQSITIDGKLVIRKSCGALPS